MDQRISFVTLAVADLDASRRFYVDGLGWEPALDVPGEVMDTIHLSIGCGLRPRKHLVSLQAVFLDHLERAWPEPDQVTVVP